MNVIKQILKQAKDHNGVVRSIKAFTFVTMFALAITTVSAAYVGPTQAPTGGNPPVPINAGNVDQDKSAGLSLLNLLVTSNAQINGKVGIGGAPLSTYAHKLQIMGASKGIALIGGGAGGNNPEISFENGVVRWAITTNPLNNSLLINSNSLLIDGGLNNVGNVGIGAISPGARLHVNGGIRADSYCDQNGENCLTSEGGTGGTSLWTGSLTGNINNANSGNVGIGTTDPQAKLDVNGGLFVDELVNIGPRLFIRPDGANFAWIGTGFPSANMNTGKGLAYGFGVDTNGAVNWLRMFVNGTERIGLTPSENRITGNTVVQGLGFAVGTKAIFSVVGDVRADSYCDLSGQNCLTPGGGTGGSFWTGSLTGNINSANSGNVGIGTGTTAPLAKLDVNGSVVVNRLDSLGTVTSNYLFVKNVSPQIALESTGSGKTWRLDSNTNGKFRVFEGGAEHFNVKSDGIVGARTDFCLFNNSACLKGLSSSVTNILTRIDNIDTEITNINTQITNLEGGTSLWTAGTGSKIYYNSGKVGIGTTDPLAKLHVNGTAEVDGNLNVVGSGKRINLFGSVNTWGIDSHTNGNFRVFAGNNVNLIAQPDGIVRARTDFCLFDNSACLSDVAEDVETLLAGGSGLPTGSANDTLRHNGTGWVSDSLLNNTGSQIRITGDTAPNLPYSLFVGGDGIHVNNQKLRMSGSGIAGKTIISNDVQGTFSWGSAVISRTWNYAGGSSFTSSASSGTGASSIQLTVDENNGIGARDFVVLRCPAGRTAIGGGAVCDANGKLNSNGPGGTNQDWRISCGTELNKIQKVRVSCALEG